MASIRKTIRKILVWSYERGTIQYDIICVLILAFIFFVPRSCFVSRPDAQPRTAVKQVQVNHQQTQNLNEYR